MIIRCPKCQGRHDVTDRKSGETFACSCGNILRAPKKTRAGWIVALVVVASLGVPCLGTIAVALPNDLRFNMRSKSSEARFHMLAIRAAELAYYGSTSSLVAAGPVPRQVPRGRKADFLQDDGFRALGWKPEGSGFHQYEVQLTGPKSGVITARGDIDGDGEVAVYTLEFSVDGPQSDLEKAVEDVY